MSVVISVVSSCCSGRLGAVAVDEVGLTYATGLLALEDFLSCNEGDDLTAPA